MGNFGKFSVMPVVSGRGGEERRGRGGGGVGEVGRPPLEGTAIGRRGARDGLRCPEKVDVDVDK